MITSFISDKIDRMSKPLTFSEKIFLTYSTIKHPYKIILDKLGYKRGEELFYLTKNSVKFFTRGGTTDIDEAIVIFSGLEYPKEALHLKSIQNPIIIDAGAHIGLFSLYLKWLYPSSQIIAIEPLTENYKLMTKNFDINSICGIKTINLALSNKKGKINIILPDKKQFDSATTVFTSNSYYKLQRVKTSTLKNIIDQEKIKTIDLLKLDIEGAEYEIIKNEIKTLKSTIKNVLVEYHSNKGNNMRKNIIKALNNNNFELYFENRHILGFNNTKI